MMEREVFLSGYCRHLDQSRMVTVELEDQSLVDVDCCYGGCVYEPNCEIAKSIRALLEGTE
ncbi:MAG: hypothetical protein ACI3VZ_07060 [Faecousia sp.]